MEAFVAFFCECKRVGAVFEMVLRWADGRDRVVATCVRFRDPGADVRYRIWVADLWMQARSEEWSSVCNDDLVCGRDRKCI